MQTPSPDKSTQSQRREPLRWMAAAALLLAFLSICCIAQTVTFLLAPRNQRSSLDLRSKLLADYARWGIDLPLPGIGPEVPAAQAADLATATSVALLGTPTPVIVGAAPTAELAIVPPVANAPTPTLPGVGTVPPAPTATSPAIAGGGVTSTPTRGPTSSPTENGATAVGTPLPTSAATPTDTRQPQNATRTPTQAPTAEPTDKPTSPPDKEPTARPTTEPQPDTPQPTAVPPTNPPPPATNTPGASPKPTDKPPDKTPVPKTPTFTPTRLPTVTATRAPTVTATRVPTVAPTPTSTPVPPSPTDTPVTPSPTPTDTPVTPTVGTIEVVKVGGPDPISNGAQFQYTLTITNRTGAGITVTQIDDTTETSFIVTNCYDTQALGACSPPLSPGIEFSWFAPGAGVPLANNASMQFVIEGNFTGATPGSQVCNKNFKVTTSVGSETRTDTACVTVN